MTSRLQSVLGQSVAHILIGGMLVGLFPPLAVAQEAKAAPAAPTQEPAPKQEPAPRPDAAGVRANRVIPKTTPPPALPVFSGNPTDDEIFRARLFSEPLVPSHAPAVGENQALAAALLDYAAAPAREDTKALEAFLSAYPDSAWRLALLSNLGTVYRRTGYFQRALARWGAAVAEGRNVEDPRVRALVDGAIAGLAALDARLGRQVELETLLKDLKDRSIVGSAGESLGYSREALGIMRAQPAEAFRCGPLAVAAILRAVRGHSDPRVDAAPSTPRGTSMLAMKTLAATAGLEMLALKRQGDAAIPVPALVHWKAGHFGALVRKERDRYLLQDPTFGDEMWVSESALREEATGAFLVRRTAKPEAWSVLTDEEAGQIWGKGIGNGASPNSSGPLTNCNCNKAMAGYAFHKVQAGLVLTDTPILYAVPFGPSIDFTLTYNQRESFQPQVFTYSNFGAKWKHSFLSYIEDDPNNPSQTAYYLLPGIGREPNIDFDPVSKDYAPQFESHAILSRETSSPVRYERRTTDGSVQVFEQTDGAVSFPRKVFLTEIRDPQGNAARLVYDSSLRLAAIVDAAGQVTTFSYDDASDPLKITRITDPFGRYAEFTYAAGRLASIRDVIGLTSSFTYESNDFISTLTTPYGSTHFRWGQADVVRWVEATDPMGGTERLEYHFVADNVPGVTGYTVPDAVVPVDEDPDDDDFDDLNAHMPYLLSFYWDKLAYSRGPSPENAEITHWMAGPDHGAIGVIKAIKKPLENLVWYDYPDSYVGIHLGNTSLSSKMGRVLDDGSSQITRYEYNARGLRTKVVDPMGATTVYEYAPNYIDLLSVKVGNIEKDDATHSTFDTIAKYDYDTDEPPHLPAILTDAADQHTEYHYNERGQVLTVTTPPRAGITENRTTTYSYDSTTGLLLSVTSPGGVTTTNAYDSAARLKSVTSTTSLESYTVSYEYDPFDRLVITRYPDLTFEEIQYEKLDPVRRRDRLGRWTHTFYDAMRRVVSTRDPEGRTVNQQWCSCGSLEKLIDANGNPTRWERDVQGRITKEIRANDSFKTFVYESTTSHLESVVDAKAQETHYVYGLDDKLRNVNYVNATAPTANIAYSYLDPTNLDPVSGLALPDAHGRLRSMSDGFGTTTYSYLPFAGLGAGRLQSVDAPIDNDPITYGYDELGRVVSRTLAGVTTTWAYDQQGRLTTIGDPIGSFTYAYWGNTGRVQTVTYPNGQSSSYTYLPVAQDLRLQTIHHKKPNASTLNKFDYTYDAIGNIKTWTQQTDSNPAQVYDYEYDGADQLEFATLKNAGGTVLTRYRYDYDPAGNRAVEQIDGAATLSTFDNMNRLTTQTAGGSLVFRGTLNETASVTVATAPATVTSGNQFTGTAPVGTGTTSVAVKATDPTGNIRTNTYQVNQSGAPKTFTYDPNGNLTGNGTNTYVWDGADHLVEVRQGASVLAAYNYRADGLRGNQTIGPTATTYILDGSTVLEERPNAGAVKRYIYGPNIDQPLAQAIGGSVSYNVGDHLGSIVRTTDTAGAPTLTRDYDPWGRPLQGSLAGGYAFTGRDWDPETRLYFYRARYYDYSVGRFLSEDPSGQDRNPYSYAASNPIRFTDPSGLRITATVTFDGPGGNPNPGGGRTTFHTDKYNKRACKPVPGSTCFSFDVDLRIHIYQHFSGNPAGPSLESPMHTLQQHEDMHREDFETWLSSGWLNRRIRTTFPTEKACKAGRDRFDADFQAYLKIVEASSYFYRDLDQHTGSSPDPIE